MFTEVHMILTVIKHIAIANTNSLMQKIKRARGILRMKCKLKLISLRRDASDMSDRIAPHAKWFNMCRLVHISSENSGSKV